MFLNFWPFKNPVPGTPTAAVLGGTFNPVHLGHLGMLESVRQALDLDRMLLLPTAVPPHKQALDLAPATDREAMLRAAIAGRDRIEICPLEMDGSRVSYTFDTLERLREGPEPLEPVFILGSDSLLQFHTWRNHEALLDGFDLALVDRPHVELAGIRERLDAAIAKRIVEIPGDETRSQHVRDLEPGRGGRIFHVPAAPMAISSSEIRRRAADGEALTGLVPAAVAEYIQASGLYRREKKH